jgi:hypothetical protein
VPFEYFSVTKMTSYRERSKEEKWELLGESDKSLAANKKRELAIQIVHL